MTDLPLPIFDSERDYGDIAGHFEENDPMLGARYQQDGFLFRVDGTLIEEALTAKDRKRLADIQAENAAVAAARAAFKHHAPGFTDAQIAKMVNADALKAANDDEDIDLVAWARGTKKYNYGKVQAAFRDRFSQTPVNKGQALEILSEHGLITHSPAMPTIPSMS